MILRTRCAIAHRVFYWAEESPPATQAPNETHEWQAYTLQYNEMTHDLTSVLLRKDYFCHRLSACPLHRLKTDLRVVHRNRDTEEIRSFPPDNAPYPSAIPRALRFHGDEQES